MHERSTRVEVKAMLEAGLSKTAVARQLGVTRQTIHRRESEATALRGRKRRAHKLDPYKGIVHDFLKSCPKLTAQRLFEEIRAAGYDGGYGRVPRKGDSIPNRRPRHAKQPTERHSECHKSVTN